MRNSTETARLNAFLQAFPRGCHAKDASDRIASLNRAETRKDAAGAKPLQNAQTSQAPAICPADAGPNDPKWAAECIGRLAPDVGSAIQQARDAKSRANQQAAAARAAQMRSATAATAARDAEKRARSPSHPGSVVVQDFTAQRLGVYAGTVSDGVRQGNGVWIAVNGEHYEGEWNNDGRNGVGKSIPVSGPTFEGTWKDGIPCGVGVLTWPNGDRYEGDYCNGHYSGYGIFYYSDSNTNYARENIGQWTNDKQTGYGVRLWDGQNRSEGRWQDGELNGYGAEFAANGQIQTKLNIGQQGLYERGALKAALKR